VGVTAKHCTRSGRSAEFKIGFEGEEGSFKVESIEKLPNSNDDMVVFILAEDADIIKPYGIAQKVDKTWIGREVVMVGYGKRSRRGTEGIGMKSSGTAIIENVCPGGIEGKGEKYYINCDLLPIKEAIIIRGEDQGPLQGDSGGPLFDKETGLLLGVTSVAPGIKLLGKVGYYVKVAGYLDFIHEILKKVGCVNNNNCPANYICKDGTCVYNPKFSEPTPPSPKDDPSEADASDPLEPRRDDILGNEDIILGGCTILNYDQSYAYLLALILLFCLIMRQYLNRNLSKNRSKE
jgi:hypothetical protein